MKTKFIIFSIIQCLFIVFLKAQDDANPEIIQNIRKDFYHINNHLFDYEKIESGNGLTAWFKGNQLYKVIDYNSEKDYYFNGEFSSPYFVYSYKGGAENRYYFDQKKLIRWVDEEKNFKVETDRYTEGLNILEESQYIFNKAFSTRHHYHKQVFLVIDNEYLLLNELDFKSVGTGKPKLNSEEPLIVSYSVSLDKLPIEYQTLLNQDILIYNKEGEQLQTRIVDFTMRNKISYLEELWTPGENLSEEEKLKRLDEMTGLDYGYLYAVIEKPENFEPAIACFNPDLIIYKPESDRPIPEKIKKTFINSDEFQKVDSKFQKLKEELKNLEGFPHEKDKDYNPRKNTYSYAFAYPDKPTIYIIGASSRGPCHGYLDYAFDKILIQKNNSIESILEESFGYDIEMIFNYDNSGTLYFLFSDNYSNDRVLGIGKVIENKAFEIISEWHHFIPGCGC